MYEILFPPKTLVKYIKTQGNKDKKNTKWNKSNKTLEAGNQGNYGKEFNQPPIPPPPPRGIQARPFNTHWGLIWFLESPTLRKLVSAAHSCLTLCNSLDYG